MSVSDKKCLVTDGREARVTTEAMTRMIVFADERQNFSQFS